MRWRLLLLLLLGASTSWSLAVPAPTSFEPRLELHLKADTTNVKGGDKAIWEAWIVNRGKKTVTLVQPGDGSDCGWRTPIIEWGLDELEVRKTGTTTERKTERKPLCLTEGAPRTMRCGNINRLREEEVFDLAPGKEVKLSVWIGRPHLQPGKHKIVMRYFNLPDHKWKGLPLGEHDKKAMQRVKNSLKVFLQSNPVEIVVEE
jgi:hypothetical protein